MKAEKISAKQARRLALDRQGLLRKQPFGKAKSATLAAIQQLGYIQIDTISVINRTHHHVLWTRIPDYRKDFLHQLMTAEKHVFEYWSHAAAYLPMADFRFSLPRKHALATGESHWFARDAKMMQRVLDRIRAEGPLQARDFKTPEAYQNTEMWRWKPAKIALEQLFMEGELMIKERKGFQKVFDLTERVLPTGTDTRLPSSEEYAQYLVRHSLDAHGIAKKEEMGYLRKAQRKKGLDKALIQLVEAGEIIPLTLDKQTYYTRPAFLEKLPLRVGKKQLHLLSPFDNAVIQRKRLKQLFDFDYQIECYVPAAKRKFGYFVLPILWGDELVGRLDPKADKKNKTLYIRNLVFETDVVVTDELLSSLAEKLSALARFNHCERLVVEKSFPDFGKVLEASFLQNL